MTFSAEAPPDRTRETLDRRPRWAINGRFYTQPVTGVQRYAREITKAIDARLVADENVARRMRWEVILPADCPAIPDMERITTRRSARGRGYIWEQTILPFAAHGGLVNFANLAPVIHRRQIICLHDANVFVEPDSYAVWFARLYRTLYPLLARRAQDVVTVSQFSRSMLEQFKVVNTAATVIGNGHEHALAWNARASRFSEPGRFRRPFVFALGSRAKHKQIDRLLTLAPALDAMGLDLVISGGTSTIFSAMDLAAHANVIRLGYVSDDDLAALFGRALCFAFPSRTEGFGIPLLEAMVHGCPIVTTDCASMPEVCGDAALYGSASDPGRWLAAIKALQDDPTLAASLRAKGASRYPLFSWAKGADAYLGLALAFSPERNHTTKVTYRGRDRLKEKEIPSA